MLVAGVVLSSSAGAVLARCLEHAGEIELAQDLGIAVDANRSEVRLAPRDEHAILLALDDCPIELQALKDALRANA